MELFHHPISKGYLRVDCRLFDRRRVVSRHDLCQVQKNTRFGNSISIRVAGQSTRRRPLTAEQNTAARVKRLST